MYDCLFVTITSGGRNSQELFDSSLLVLKLSACNSLSLNNYRKLMYLFNH